MSVKVESNTDSQEQVSAANGVAPVVENQNKKPAAGEEKSQDPAETTEDEGASEIDSEQDDGEQEENIDGEKSEVVQKKPLKGFKKRIDKLSKRLAQTEQERDSLREQLSRGQKPQENKRDPKSESANAEGKPKSDDYETHDEYLEAVTDWKFDQREKTKEQMQKTEQMKSDQKKQSEAYSQKAESLKEIFEDYDDVMDSVDDVNMSLTVQRLLLKAENGPELGYQLAKNKELFAKICQMDPEDAAREFGKFEAKFTSSQSKETKPEKKLTNAPAPIKPVGSSASSTEKKSLDDMDYKDFKREREKKRA